MTKNWLLVIVGAWVMSGCAIAQRAESALDCNAICNRYSECFDKQYDVSTCATKCRDSARSDTNYRRKADICNACITDRSCSSATFSCTTECASVVP